MDPRGVRTTLKRICTMCALIQSRLDSVKIMKRFAGLLSFWLRLCWALLFLGVSPPSFMWWLKPAERDVLYAQPRAVNCNRDKTETRFESAAREKAFSRTLTSQL
jgi:hypothetical protein